MKVVLSHFFHLILLWRNYYPHFWCIFFFITQVFALLSLAQTSLYISVSPSCTNFLYKLPFASISALFLSFFVKLYLKTFLRYLCEILKYVCFSLIAFASPHSTTNFPWLVMIRFWFSKNLFRYFSNDVRHLISHDITIFLWANLL